MKNKKAFLKTSLSAIFTVVMSGNVSAGELNILTWEGYADASVVEPFEAATGCKVSATYVGSNDDFAPKDWRTLVHLLPDA